jgi:hypothetical protein
VISKKLYLLFKVIIFLLMGIYALLKDLRDVLWTKIFGFKAIAFIKYTSFLSCIIFWFLFNYYNQNKKLSSVFFFLSSLYTFLFGLFSLFLFFFESSLFTFEPYVYFFSFIFYIICEGFPIFMYGLCWGMIDYISKKDDAKERYGSLIIVSEAGGILALCTACYVGLVKNFFSLFFIIFLLFSILTCGAFLIKKYFYFEYVTNQSEVTEDTSIKKISFLKKDFSFFFHNFIPFFIFMLVFVSEVFNTGFHFLRLEALGKEAITNEAIFSYLIALYRTSLVSYLIGFLIMGGGRKFFINLFSMKQKTFFISCFLFSLGLVSFLLPFKSVIISLSIFFKAFQRTIIFPFKEGLLLFIDTTKRVSCKIFVDSFSARAGKFFVGTLISFVYFFFGQCSLVFYFCIFTTCSLLLFFLGIFIAKKFD